MTARYADRDEVFEAGDGLLHPARPRPGAERARHRVRVVQPQRRAAHGRSGHDAEHAGDAERLDDLGEAARGNAAILRQDPVAPRMRSPAHRVRVRGAEAALVSRVHRLEHVERLTAANLTDDDPIRPHAKGVPDVRLVLLGALSTLPGTRWHDVRGSGSLRTYGSSNVYFGTDRPAG